MLAFWPLSNSALVFFKGYRDPWSRTYPDNLAEGAGGVRGVIEGQLRLGVIVDLAQCSQLGDLATGLTVINAPHSP